jgi:hypothetical protein
MRKPLEVIEETVLHLKTTAVLHRFEGDLFRRDQHFWRGFTRLHKKKSPCLYRQGPNHPVGFGDCYILEVLFA